MRYEQIWSTIKAKVDKAVEANNACPLLMVGEYSTAYAMRWDNVNTLFDEYMQDNPRYSDMGVKSTASDDEQLEQFKAGIRAGNTFGDYQQFILFADKLQELKVDVERWTERNGNPAHLYDNYDYYNAFSVWVNGHKPSIYDDLARQLPELAELDEYLSELNNL